jgi:hypothetical protein
MAFQQYREVGTAYSGAWTEFSLNIVFEDDPSSVAPSPVVMLAEGVLDHTCCEGLTGCTLPTHNKLKSRPKGSSCAQASDNRQERHKSEFQQGLPWSSILAVIHYRCCDTG